MLVEIAGRLVGSLIGLLGEWGKGKRTEIEQRLQAMQRTWTDEVIVVTVFSPLWVGWFSEARAEAWVQMVDRMPEWYTGLLFAITGAVFGLGKINGRRK